MKKFIALGVAAILGVLSYISADKTLNYLNHGVYTRGEVVELFKKEGTTKVGRHSKRRKTTKYAAIVVFQSEAGQEHRFQDSVAAKPALFEVGDRVDVIYLADDPKQAIVDRGVWNWSSTMIFGFFFMLSLFFVQRVFSRVSNDRV